MAPERVSKLQKMVYSSALGVLRAFNLNEEFPIPPWTRVGDEAGAVGGLDEGVPGIRCF